MVKEKLSWEKQKGESTKSYNRFLVFLKLPPEQRSLDKALENIKSQEKSTNPEKTNKITLTSIQKLSSKWCWFERAGLYDHHLQLQEMEEEAASFHKNNKVFKDVFIKSLNFADELLEKLIANENDNALSTRINMFNTLMNVLDSLYRNYRLSSGRSTRISESIVDANVDANVETSIVEDNIFSYSPEEMERIQNIQEMDEETQRFLDEL